MKKYRYTQQLSYIYQLIITTYLNYHIIPHDISNSNECTYSLKFSSNKKVPVIHDVLIIGSYCYLPTFEEVYH